MEEASENGKESPHSVHANGLIDCTLKLLQEAYDQYKYSEEPCFKWKRHGKDEHIWVLKHTIYEVSQYRLQQEKTETANWLCDSFNDRPTVKRVCLITCTHFMTGAVHKWAPH